jgi:hypothetical protein
LDGDSVQLWSDPEDRHNAVMKADRNAESGRWFFAFGLLIALWGTDTVERIRWLR